MTSVHRQMWLNWVTAAMAVDPGNAVASANEALKEYRKLQGLYDEETLLQRFGDRLLGHIDDLFLSLHGSPIQEDRNRAAELGILEQCRNIVKNTLVQHGCKFPKEET